MKHTIKPTLTWDDAPDTLDPETYAKIRGIGKNKAEEKFKEKNFPIIEGGKAIADKTAVRLYDMGINPKIQTKESINFLVYTELKKISSKLNTNPKKELITNEKN